MEDDTTPEKLFTERRTSIGLQIAALLTEACGEDPAFVLVVQFESPASSGQILSNLPHEELQAMLAQAASTMRPPKQEGK